MFVGNLNASSFIEVIWKKRIIYNKVVTSRTYNSLKD